MRSAPGEPSRQRQQHVQRTKNEAPLVCSRKAGRVGLERNGGGAGKVGGSGQRDITGPDLRGLQYSLRRALYIALSQKGCQWKVLSGRT